MAEGSFAIAQRLAEADPQNAQAQRDLSLSLNKLGDLELREGDAAKARGHFEESLEINRILAAADPRNAQAQRDLSVSLERFGVLALRANDVAEARKLFAQSHEIRNWFAEADPQNVQAQFNVGYMAGKLAIAELRTGSQAQAREHLIEANAAYDALIASGGEAGLAPGGLGLSALMNSVEMALLLGDPADAVARARRALEQVDASDQSCAIMPFLIWLADPAEETPEAVLTAIEGLTEGVRFIWSFQDIAPLIVELPPERKRLAEAFIAHFEGRLDLADLKEIIGGPAPDAAAD